MAPTTQPSGKPRPGGSRRQHAMRALVCGWERGWLRDCARPGPVAAVFPSRWQCNSYSVSARPRLPPNANQRERWPGCTGGRSADFWGGATCARSEGRRRRVGSTATHRDAGRFGQARPSPCHRNHGLSRPRRPPVGSLLTALVRSCCCNYALPTAEGATPMCTSASAAPTAPRWPSRS